MAQGFDFWQDHSERFLRMAYTYDRNKKLESPDGLAVKTGVCGDTITIYVNLANDRLSDFSYELSGCMHTNACCNSLAEMTLGKEIYECWKVVPEDIINDLQTLPEDHYHCAELAVGTFFLALTQLS